MYTPALGRAKVKLAEVATTVFTMLPRMSKTFTMEFGRAPAMETIFPEAVTLNCGS